jgi:hypothetical protein
MNLPFLRRDGGHRVSFRLALLCATLESCAATVLLDGRNQRDYKSCISMRSVLSYRPELDPVRNGCLGAIAAIEAIVVVIEYFLFRQVFKRLLRLGTLEYPVSPKRTFIMVLIANTVSFALPALSFISMGPLAEK